MANFQEQLSALRQAAQPTFERLDNDFAPTANDLTMFRLMGVEANKNSVSELKDGKFADRNVWKEESSTWSTKK